MTVVRYRPLTEMNSLQKQLDRIFVEAFTPASLSDDNYSVIPAAELTETEEALILKLELPGIKLADVNIEATVKSISISGDRQPKQQEKTRSEFRYGSFQRVIPLPVKIQNTEVKAQYKDGILHLTLPKAAAEINKVVKVSLGKADC